MSSPTGESVIQRYYPIPNLDFRAFWDICSHFQRVNKEFHVITYTVEGEHSTVVKDEPDVSVILREINSAQQKATKIVARFYTADEMLSNEYGNSKLMYLPSLNDFQQAGLYYYSDVGDKLTLYKFEKILYANYEMEEEGETQIEFGVPCEVLSVVVDMRGFSAFCEQPNIESPYTCGLMTSFYHMVRTAFIRYPPEMMKFLGDGVLAIWQTTSVDRQIAIEVCLEGVQSLNQKWAEVRRGPHFSHGAPKDIGAGLCFGLASKITVGDDYIGRPINIASRLCSVCPPGHAYIDKSVPGVSAEPNLKEVRVRIKSFGDYPVWALYTD